MNNFGVVEVASTRTTHAPGWAYVPDTSVGPAAALQPANRKRARNQTHANASDLSARQEAKLRKELEALDRDSHRDAHVAVPSKPGGGSRGTTPPTPPCWLWKRDRCTADVAAQRAGGKKGRRR